MKIILSILSSFILQICIAQNVSFEAKILDNNNKPIPYATIFLQSSKTATTSNFDGEAKLVVNKKILPDTLVLRHIGFETQKFYLNEENIDSFKHIVLKEKLNELDIVEIRAYTAEQIIALAIENIDKNYYKNIYFVDGFYRQAHKENDKYVRLIECFATVKEDISNRKSTAQKEQFYISKIRRSNVYERNGDKHGDHLADLFLENPINYAHSSFLNKQAYRLYNFSFENYGFTDTIKIVFQNKAWQNPENKSGYILINRKDYAVVEMEIVSTKNHFDKTNNKSNWKFQNGTYKVSYEKHEGIYLCKSSSKYYNHYVLNEFTQNIDYIVEEYFDWDRKTLNIMQKVENLNFKSFSNLYSKIYNYEPSNWKFIRPNKKIISDLNSFMDLEKQFEDD